MARDAQRDVGRFGDWASTYDRSYLQRMLFEPVHRTMLDLAGASTPNAILDVGCGTGRLLRGAADIFPSARLEGVDAAAEMIHQAQIAESPRGRINFTHAVAEKLPFPDWTFDLVFSSMTFHHWQDQAQGAGEIARVMTPGGRWLLADFVPRGLLRLLPLGRFPKREFLEPMLSRAGLEIAQERRVPRLGGQVSVLVITKSGEASS